MSLYPPESRSPTREHLHRFALPAHYSSRLRGGLLEERWVCPCGAHEWRTQFARWSATLLEDGTLVEVGP